MSAIPPVLTLDGPSGSGKGTVSRRVARSLGWHFLDSGSIYRALALAALDRGISLDQEQPLAGLAETLDLVFSAEDPPSVWLEGVDITDRLVEERTGNAASKVAQLIQVRQALLERQRAFRQAPGLVADGRDMGSVVFPDAQFKIYLTASAGVRARRRLKQLSEKGISVSIEGLTQEIEERDQRDQARAVSPLVVPKGALVIDSSDLTIEAVVSTVLEHISLVP